MNHPLVGANSDWIQILWVFFKCLLVVLLQTFMSPKFQTGFSDYQFLAEKLIFLLILWSTISVTVLLV
jgi:hypothetical protein